MTREEFKELMDERQMWATFALNELTDVEFDMLLWIADNLTDEDREIFAAALDKIEMRYY